jgi:very-short-patch-repair endonuclease
MSPEHDKHPRLGDGCRVRNTTDRVIAALAARQRGVISRDQLLAAGVRDNPIKHRVRAGRLHPLHRGVYLVGHSVPADGARELAALLACGERSVLSHTTAARQWRLIPGVPDAEIEITLVAHHAGTRPGIRVHRVSSLARKDVRTLDGLRVTTPARTLLDLAAVVRPAPLERALADALARNLVSERQITDQLTRNPGRPGTPTLRAAAGLDGGPALTRSEAERRLLALIRAADLPIPHTNARVCRYEVDFLWPEHRLVVEVDGYAFHSHRRAFERDRERDAALAATGYLVIRVTWRQLTANPAAVTARIASALASRAPR